MIRSRDHVCMCVCMCVCVNKNVFLIKGTCVSST
jgi:hypothetical protein